MLLDSDNRRRVGFAEEKTRRRRASPKEAEKWDSRAPPEPLVHFAHFAHLARLCTIRFGATEEAGKVEDVVPFSYRRAAPRGVWQRHASPCRPTEGGLGFPKFLLQQVTSHYLRYVHAHLKVDKLPDTMDLFYDRVAGKMALFRMSSWNGNCRNLECGWAQCDVRSDDGYIQD
jgi:hypothetical protein